MATVAVVRGEVDLVSSQQIHDALAEALDAGHTTLVFDFSGVTFMDSQGINALTWAHQRMRASGGSLIVRRPSSAVLTVFQVTGLDRFFDIERD